MIDHLTLTVRDLGRAKSFYTSTLAPLGYGLIMDFGEMLGFVPLDLDQLLPLARGALLFLLLELVLTIVENLADRRVGVGGNLDEVQPGFLCGFER